MEQFDDNVYVIDLGEINTAPEIIFELSSVLDKDEAKNKRICLKLGNVDLNQAQLLSIKSLINSIDSTLSSIETKSVETEKTALSLGIIISNISEQNAVDISPTMTYKTAEELKEELQAQENNSAENENSYDIIEENETDVIEEVTNENIQNEVLKEVSSEAETQEENNDAGYDNNSNGQTFVPQPPSDNTDEVQDELDVIFGSSLTKNSFFDTEATKPLYEEKEELEDITVPEHEYTKEDIELETFPTKYIKQTIRSGQVINYEGNIVIIGDCHPGCEITALGDITVWGVLSGIAHAGAGGNQKARVRALKMNAIQLRIAGCYSRRPDSLNTVFIEKTNSFTTEEARIVNGEIVVFKIND